MKIFILLLFIFLKTQCFAQNKISKKKNDSFNFGFSVGKMLPGRIAGISEILPTAGFRGAINRKNYYLEGSIIGGNAFSVNFYTIFLCARNFMKTIDPGSFWTFGLHKMYYKRSNILYESVIINDETHKSWSGFNYGFGYLWKSEDFSPRLDFILAKSPGFSLYMTLGLEF